MVRTWYVTMLVPSKIPLSMIWHLNFAETKKSHQYFNWNYDQTYDTRKNRLRSIISSTADSHTKGMLFLLHLSLEGITEVGTDPNERFVSFKVTLSNDRVLSLHGIKPESSWLGGHFLKGLQSYTQNKNKGNKSKIILRGLILLWIK